MVARMLGAAARQEVEHKSERTRRAQLQAAQAGKWLGGAYPLGWIVRGDGSAVLDRQAAARIRTASNGVLAGRSLGSIIASWNSAGFKTSRGGSWTYTSARQVLTRARNAGKVEFHDEIVADMATWPAIVSEEVWRGVREVLTDPSRRRSDTNKTRWLLAGIATCGRDGCGQAMRSSTAISNRARRTTRTVYRCSAPGSGGHVARAARDLDNLVTIYLAGGDLGTVVPELAGEMIIGRLARPDLSDLVPFLGHASVALADLRAEATALRKRLTSAAEQFADGTLTDSQLATVTTRVRAALAEVESRLTTPDTALANIVGAENPVTAYLGAPLERKRAVIRELMTIRVLPSGKRGTRFDPDLIEITWRVA